MHARLCVLWRTLAGRARFSAGVSCITRENPKTCQQRLVMRRRTLLHGVCLSSITSMLLITDQSLVYACNSVAASSISGRFLLKFWWQSSSPAGFTGERRRESQDQSGMRMMRLGRGGRQAGIRTAARMPRCEETRSHSDKLFRIPGAPPAPLFSCGRRRRRRPQ